MNRNITFSILATIIIAGGTLFASSFLLTKKNVEAVSQPIAIKIEQPITVELPEIIAPLLIPETLTRETPTQEMLSKPEPEPAQTSYISTAKEIIDLLTDSIQKIIGLIMSGGGAILMIREIKKGGKKTKTAKA